MKRVLVALTLAFGFASSAHAAPGDARLIQGTLEWPAKLAGEPFVVVRAEDGRWYYVEIRSTKRLGSGPLTAGGRVAILGVEAGRPHEITAVAVGTGDAAALALAVMAPGGPALATPERAPDTAPAPSAAPQPTSESPVPSKPQATEQPSTPNPVEATPPAASAAGTANKPEPAAAPPAWPVNLRRWSELRGTIRMVDGNSMVVRSSDDQLVIVDVSSANLTASSLRPGSPIAVYGMPGERGFQAMGLVVIEADKEPLARPVPVPPRRGPSPRTE